MKKNVFAYTGVHFGVCRINTKYDKKASMWSVMANISFRATKVMKDGLCYVIPQEGINQLTGRYKVAVAKAIENPTIENIMHAHELYGMTVEVA